MRTIPNLRYAMVALLLAVAATLTACGPAEQSEDDRPLVIATTTILGDIVRQTAGEGVYVEVLMPIGADPHEFAPSAQQAARLRSAVLVVTNGVGLEAGLLDVVDAAEAEGVAVLRLGDLLDPQPFTGVDEHDDEDEAGHGDEEGHEGEADHDDEGEHEHGNGLDPHIWMDPVRVADGVPLIADRLLEAGGVDVTEEAAAYREQILDLHDEISTLIDEIPSERRKMVTNHFSYGYYADRYGLQMLGTVIPAATTAAETSAADFAALVELLEQEQVPAIFGSTTEPAALAEVLAAEVGYDVNVVTLYTGSLGELGSGAETYVDMMLASTQMIVENLR